jgi:hypothetical protein
MEKISDCVHHWIIGKAVGPKSQGKCRLCGKQREFLNSWDAAVEARFMRVIHHAWQKDKANKAKAINKAKHGGIVYGLDTFHSESNGTVHVTQTKSLYETK